MKLKLSPDLSLPLDAITQTFGVLAVRGAGKTNTAVVMAEEMYAARLPFIVVDPVGVWFGLRSSSDGTKAGLEIPVLGGKHGDLPLERGGGEVVADLVVDERLSAVLDLSEFDSEASKKDFLLAFARRLYRRNEQPLHLFLEEADDYIPQRPMRDEAQLLRAFENIVRRGRSRGLGITLITQRSAAINKNVLTQVETLIVLRTTSPQDRKAIEEWVRYHDVSRELLESLSGLENGEAWVWSPHWLGALKRLRIRRRETFDSAATPKGQTSRPAARLADVDLGALQKRMAATIERAKAEDPRELRKKIQDIERQLRSRPTEQVEKVVEKLVEIPVLKDRQLERAEILANRMIELADRMTIAGTELRVEIGKAVRRPQPAPVHMQPHPQPRMQPGVQPPAAESRRASRREPEEGALPAGERRVLTAVAQHDAGVTRQQLTILTGYRRSTRDAYVQRLRERGLVDTSGDSIRATRDGMTYLGPRFETLPTGDQLREYWIGRLPEGERRILEILVAAHPGPVDREAISDATGYARSSRDAYLQRLGARRLVISEGRGMVRAAPELFG